MMRMMMIFLAPCMGEFSQITNAGITRRGDSTKQVETVDEKTRQKI